MTLREVLHAHLPLLTPASTVRDAVDKMDVYQFPALVVVSEEQAPIAVVTEGDICRAVNQSEGLLSIANSPVLPYCTRDPQTAHADTEVGDAYHQMISSGLTILPVVDLGRLLGVVLRVDLMQAMMLDVR